MITSGGKTYLEEQSVYLVTSVPYSIGVATNGKKFETVDS